MFSGKKTEDKDKLRGGYYTPSVLSDYLCNWAIREATDRILEPSCGDGNFIHSVCKTLSELAPSKQHNINAVEIVNDELLKAQSRIKRDHNSKFNSINWHNNDFFEFYSHQKLSSYDVIVGNPPFIRFQYFDNNSRELAFDHLREAGYKPTKLANAWAAFVQLSIQLLAPKGRLAMVVPAELLQVKYAQELRERITRSFEHVVIVSFKKLVFKDIQQEVVLLLAEGKRQEHLDHSDVHTIEIESENELSVEMLESKIKHQPAKHTNQNVKWTSLFLSQPEFNAIEKISSIDSLHKLGDFASVDVGIVTGRNKFFVVDKQTVDQYQLKDFVVPLVGKTSAINNIEFTQEMLESYSESFPAFLLSLKNIDESKFSDGLRHYISLGESEEVHTGYKCRIRKRWFDVPSTHLSEGFLFRQIHKFPLLVANTAQAACTDTIHRVKLISPQLDFTQLSCSFVNSMTMAWSEVCGRSYGGGVLELEPNEAEELPLPFSGDLELDVDFIKSCLQEKNIEAAMDYVDRILLREYMNIPQQDIVLYRNAWKTLSSRRINRK